MSHFSGLCKPLKRLTPVLLRISHNLRAGYRVGVSRWIFRVILARCVHPAGVIIASKIIFRNRSDQEAFTKLVKVNRASNLCIVRKRSYFCSGNVSLLVID